MERLFLDAETYSGTDLTASGVYRYVEDPGFDIMLLSYSIDGGPVRTVDLACGEELPPAILHAILNPDITKIAHNAAFERICLSSWIRRKYPDLYAGHSLVEGWCLRGEQYIPPESWRCTMILCAYNGLPLSLEMAGAVLGLEQQKLKEGKDLVRYFAAPCKPTEVNGGRTRNLPADAPEKWARYKEYNRRDVEAELEIYRRLSNYPVPEQEWAYYWLDQRINDRGIMLDMPLVDSAIRFDEINRGNIDRELRALTGLANPNSNAQLLCWLRARGYDINSVAKEPLRALRKSGVDPQTDRVLALHAEAAKTSVKKYYAMRGCVCADGRARGQIQFYGANRTGRFSGRLIQLQNLKKNKMKGLDVARAIVRRGDYDGFAMIYDASQAVLSELVRTACVPKPGCKFIVADFSSIERVVLAWLAGEQWVLDYYAAGKDLYLATAAQMFRLNLDDLKKEDPVRGLGKLADLACGYGGSVGAMERFGALEMGLKPEELPGLVRKWRDANPRIEQYWWDIDKAAMACVRKKQSTAVRNIRFHYKGGMMFIELPSGRVLSYAKPYTTTNKFDSPAIGYWGLNDKNHWGRIESYGPKLCENITQAISRDLLCQALVNLDAAGHRTVMHVHDEAVVEAPLAIPDEEVISLMTDPLPSWAVGLPLRAAGYSGVFYFKD